MNRDEIIECAKSYNGNGNIKNVAVWMNRNCEEPEREDIINSILRENKKMAMDLLARIDVSDAYILSVLRSETEKSDISHIGKWISMSCKKVGAVRTLGELQILNAEGRVKCDLLVYGLSNLDFPLISQREKEAYGNLIKCLKVK